MKIEDIKFGMKVVPINKTKGVWGFEEWLNSDTTIPNYFKEHGYLYVIDKGEYSMYLSNTKTPQGYGGDAFHCEDVIPYASTTIKVIQELTKDNSKRFKADKPMPHILEFKNGRIQWNDGEDFKITTQVMDLKWTELDIPKYKEGDKVVPISKSSGVGFGTWMNSSTPSKELFVDRGYLYVHYYNSSDCTYVLGTESKSTGIRFKEKDLKLYTKPTEITKKYAVESHTLSVIELFEFNTTHTKVKRGTEVITVKQKGNEIRVYLTSGAMGFAICNSSDKFDEKIGTKIAYYRAKIAEQEGQVQPK